MKNMARIFVSFCLFASVLSCSPSGRAAEPAATDFTLPALDGQTKVTLSQYQGNHPVLLFFWTTWCPFCLKEIKTLNAQREYYAGKGIVILAINAGESAAAVGRLVKNYDIGLTVLLDEQDVATRAYHVLGVPTFVLVDTEGKVRFRDTRFPKEELESVSQPAG